MRRAALWSVLLGFTMTLAGGVWIAIAGSVTVYRTLAYNVSGIDDARIFLQRRMSASPTPFRFRDQPIAIEPRVDFGRARNASLSSLVDATDTVAFLVVQDDRVVFERYGQGLDRATPSLSFSMAKSFLSILVGCAIADGYLKSLDQPVTELVPELARAGFAAVRLGHLLQMTSGIDYAENDFPFGIHARLYYTDRLEAEILKFKLIETPGSRFEYKSGDALLLALALKRALRGRTISAYMQERLWHPLGMEHDGSWSLDHAPGGLEKVSCCLNATARDFAKLGRLYLHRGLWNGKRIVAEDWASRPVRYEVSDGSAWNYQYLWWRVDRDRPDFMAQGHLGQFVFVNPRTNVIIVRLGRSRGGLSVPEWQNIFLALSDRLQMPPRASSSSRPSAPARPS